MTREPERGPVRHRLLGAIIGSCLGVVVGVAGTSGSAYSGATRARYLPSADSRSVSSSAAGIGALRPAFMRISTKARVPATARRLGAVPGSEMIALDIVLAPRQSAALTALASAVSDPSSPSYRRYLPAGAFAQRFGATSRTLSALERSLRARGLDPTGVSGNRLAVHVVGRARAVERAFATPLTAYRLADGTTGFANSNAPLVPALRSSPVQAVLGLDTLSPMATTSLAFHETPPRAARPSAAAAAAAAAAGGPVPSASCAPAAAASGYTADQIASAYGFDGLYAAGDLGAGVSVGLIEFSPVSASDIAAYASCYGLASPSVTIARVGGGPRTPSVANEVEAELDLEDVVGLAPQAHVVVYEGTDAGGAVSGSSAYDTYATAVNADVVQVISTSWGSCEEAVGSDAAAAEQTLFEQAALQGQTVVAAAGDEGSEDCFGTVGGAGGEVLAVDDPASQPYVTAVGGTTLDLGGAPTESVWDTTLHVSSPGAGGGGVSRLWAMPLYQSSAASSLGVSGALSNCGVDLLAHVPPLIDAAHTGGSCRAIPDVSADAGAPYAVYCTLGQPTECANGGWTGLGGTSAAAPTWAALFALTDASSSCATTGAVGFANPALYAIAASAYSASFLDVTTGSNDLTGANPGHYNASAGFDLATGLGTPITGNGADGGLVARLCAPSTRLANSGELPRPVIANLRPQTIHARAGVRVVITGTNLSGATAVHFGRLVALSFTVLSRTKIIAIAPDGVGPVHVTVTTRVGTSPRLATDMFDYLVRPLIYRVAPPRGPSRGRTVVLIGAHLLGVVAVNFGARPAVSYVVRSPSRIVAVAPPGSGTVVVTVRTRGGLSPAVARDRYSYGSSP